MRVRYDKLENAVGCPSPIRLIESTAKRGDADDVVALIRSGADINAACIYDEPLLSRAIAWHNHDVTSTCIAHGAKLVGTLDQAIGCGDEVAVLTLLAAGVDVSEPPQHGQSPL